ncbi:MAG: divalent-cation tolerance protein CutA [Patulibacter sp.]|nr:divalent-cation tolerance protein CutA [Patulibacter sp.]
MTAEQYVQVETAVATRDDAERLAAALVEKRLAACAQIVGPIRSVYRWEGKVESAEEFVVRGKTRASLAEELKAEITALHAYDVPEILIFAIPDGAASYLDWVSAETRDPGRDSAG